MSFKLYMYTAYHFLRSLLRVFSTAVTNKIINVSIFIGCSLFIYNYLLPKLGINPQFGSFMFAGLYATTGFFEVYPSAVQLVADFEGDMEIGYYLSLPIPSWLILATKWLFFSLCSCTISLLSIPMGLLVLWKGGDFSQINFGYTLIITIINSLFYGSFTLLMGSLIPSLLEIDNVWMRFIFPLWVLGGFEFSWKILYSVTPWFAYINLLNPLIYVMEGTRAALLGQSHYLPFWSSVGAIIFFTIIFFITSVHFLKKRLDFIL